MRRVLFVAFCFIFSQGLFCQGAEFDYLGLRFGADPISVIRSLGLYDHARLNWFGGRSISITYSDRPFLDVHVADISLRFFDQKLYSISRIAAYNEDLEKKVISAIERKYGKIQIKREADGYFRGEISIYPLKISVSKMDNGLVINYLHEETAKMEFDFLYEAAKRRGSASNPDI